MADDIQIVADRIEFNGEIVALIMPNIRATLRQDFEAACKSSDRIEELAILEDKLSDLEKESNDLEEDFSNLKDKIKRATEEIKESLKSLE